MFNLLQILRVKCDITYQILERCPVHDKRSKLTLVITVIYLEFQLYPHTAEGIQNQKQQGQVAVLRGQNKTVCLNDANALRDGKQLTLISTRGKKI